MTNSAHKFCQEADNVVELVDQRRRILSDQLRILNQRLLLFTLLFGMVLAFPWLPFTVVKSEATGAVVPAVKMVYTVLCVTIYGFLFFRERRTRWQTIRKFSEGTQMVQTSIERVQKEEIT